MEVRSLLNIFEGVDNGEVTWYLGVSVKISKNSVQLSQVAYIDALLSEYKMENCEPSNTPMTSSFQVDIIKADTTETSDGTKYRNLIGFLIYLSSRTRPDIATAVNILAQYNANLIMFTWKAAHRILRYLKCTRINKMRYDNTSGMRIVPFFNADYARDNSDK